MEHKGRKAKNKYLMISNIELEIYQRITELEGISFIECNKDVLDLLKIIYLKVADLREINRNNVKKTDNNFSMTIDNFKNLSHSLKTIESKCDKNIYRFETKLEEIDKLKNDLLDFKFETSLRLNRFSNIIIVNFWVTFALICYIFFF